SFHIDGVIVGKLNVPTPGTIVISRNKGMPHPVLPFKSRRIGVKREDIVNLHKGILFFIPYSDGDTAFAIIGIFNLLLNRRVLNEGMIGINAQITAQNPLFYILLLMSFMQKGRM